VIDDFLLRALLAGLAIAAIAGPLGCFVVWRRMSYFGAALSHGALLGVALGLLLEIGPTIGIFAVCLAIALIIGVLESRHWLASDTLMGVAAHGTLALGLVLIALLDGIRVDLMGYLFGDILAVSWRDLAAIAGVAGATGAALAVLWRPLLSITVQPDLAAVDGVAVGRTRIAFVILLALVIAVGMKAVGVLLVVSMLILPAAGARRLANTPERMALIAAGLAALSVIGGLAASLASDIPTGPAIVVVSAALFVVIAAWPGRRG
jgi:zinc transport system permease protein